MSQVTIAPGRAELHVRNIAVDIILSILTCFLWNLFVQYKQMQAVNDMMKQEQYSFWSWFLLCFVTCGLYHVYHEYRMALDIEEGLGEAKDPNGPMISLVLCVFGLSVVADAIQQSRINQYYGETKL